MNKPKTLRFGCLPLGILWVLIFSACSAKPVVHDELAFTRGDQTLYIGQPETEAELILGQPLSFRFPLLNSTDVIEKRYNEDFLILYEDGAVIGILMGSSLTAIKSTDYGWSFASNTFGDMVLGQALEEHAARESYNGYFVIREAYIQNTHGEYALIHQEDYMEYKKQLGEDHVFEFAAEYQGSQVHTMKIGTVKGMVIFC